MRTTNQEVRQQWVRSSPGKEFTQVRRRSPTGYAPDGLRLEPSANRSFVPKPSFI